MPTYDYQCRSCGHTIEVIHGMLEDGPTSCERCGGQLRRILHPAGIIFKGSGFYKTDSRSSSSGSVATAGKTAAAGDATAGKGSDGASAPKASPDSSKPAGGSQPGGGTATAGGAGKD